MRFIASGPSIPDDLLLARDQGRVIFFCGAGVSRAYANLPDFFGLAEKVITHLGVIQDSPAYKLVREAQEIEERIGLPGVISADRIFGLLERDFLPRDIEKAVASGIKPPPSCDLRAHQILLDLATTPEGAVRLVTTNFDRLFDDCGRDLQVWQPPKLPDPLRPNDIDGVVYLHGRAKADYTGAEGDGFILSSSEFGRAYLSDGWATTFIREALSKFVVVFVGYSADDPPVQYLLEALKKSSSGSGNAYAFQVGDHDDAAARWRHKGVQAIPYNDQGAHSALWLTLEAWAERARNSDAWYSKIIEQAKAGPENLQPHERGQVAHIVSTTEGIKKFITSDSLPAEWLCVFDSYRRFAEPGHLRWFGDEQGPYIDPFNFYGLDSDPQPNKSNPERHHEKREVPAEAWSAFDLNDYDRLSIRSEYFSFIRGYWASYSPRLVPRLDQLGAWIANVCDQPATVWWAAHQISLHPSIRESIEWNLDRGLRPIKQEIRRAWRYLIEAWQIPKENFSRDWYDLMGVIKSDGWSEAVVRQLAKACRPYLSIEPNFWEGPKPPSSSEEIGLERLLKMDVKYLDSRDTISIPNEWCAAVTKALRQNLELAFTLETEVGGYGLYDITPIDYEKEGDDYKRKHGLSAAVIQYSEIFSQLVSFDVTAAKDECCSWPTKNNVIFERLRIWAGGKKEVLTAREFSKLISELSDESFWSDHHKRDLLLVIARRWNELDSIMRRSLERRLLKGRKRWEQEKIADFKIRRAWLTLNRIQWLSSVGCKFSVDFDELVSGLRAIVPDWEPRHAADAISSLEARGGWVRTDPRHEELKGVPLHLILSRAQELSGRTDDFLVERDPFSGFAANYPIRAFSTLVYEAKRENYPEWAWRKFLNSEKRKSDKPKFIQLIAKRLISYPNDELATIIRPLADWLRETAKMLAGYDVGAFDKLTSKLTDILREQPDQGQSGVLRGNKEKIDWTMEAINAPTGRVAEAIFRDPRVENLNAGFPPLWIKHVESLISLPNDLRRHALVLFFHHLNWFYFIDSDWTEQHFLPVLDSENINDREAAWSGFLWGNRTPHRKLYLRIKQHLLAFVISDKPKHEVLAGMILAGWGSVDEITGERCISNEEMRVALIDASDEFRSRVLWQAQRWANETKNDEQRWGDLLPDLLRVWPRQIAAKSPNTSARLIELAFSDAEKFPLLAELILPLLTKIDRSHLVLPDIRKSEDSILDRYTAQALDVFYEALPEDAHNWPYDITDEVLKRIETADKKLSSSEKLVELKRRWNAR